MDIDDPIQQFLKNTGWSCDDLLEKLQKYKSQKENKDSVESVQETEGKKIIYDKFVCETVKDVQENNDSEVPTLSCDENRDKINDVDEPVDEFSDTDEEEIEVNVTNSSIIDEIIDDIASVDNTEQLNHAAENNTHESQQNNNEEQEEVTEVRVIEVDDEEEDDYFEEECFYDVGKHNTSLIDSKNVEYLETFPRNTPIKSIDLTHIDDRNDTISEGNVTEKENDHRTKIFHNVDKNIISVQNPEHITKIKNLDTCHNILISVDDAKEDTLCSDENTDKNNSKEILEQSVDKDNELNTTMIYKKNCENVNCDRICTILDKVENNNSYFPTPEKDNQDEDFVEENIVPTNLEDIRNNLKLQLNSLRTRKKGHFLQQLRSKVTDPSECNIEKLNNKSFGSKCTNSETANTDFNESTDCFKNSIITNKEKNEEHDLYTQTNEFGLVILSVQGGIDMGEQNNVSNKQDVINEDSSNTISSALENSIDSNSFVLPNNLENTEKNEASGVFDEIRKIIRKQKQKNSTENVCSRKFNCFPKSTNIPLKLQEESNEKTECSSASADNSQSSFTCDETSQNVDKNSPFVSNTLDEFLTENSKLNISYNIPKSGAEEGLIDSYRDESPLILKKIIEVHDENTTVSRKREKIKAKTVAQKRKLLERQRLKELKKQAAIVKQPENECIVNTSETRRQKKCSYIEINNKKIWVKGTKPNVCVAKINSSAEREPPSKDQYRKKKLSLLTDLAKKCNEKIKYLPGPLSKKSTLQVSGHDDWKTETKLLPKIILEVMPKIGQCLPSNIISKLPQCDGLISTDLAEFALSVLKTKNNTRLRTGNKTFKFPIKYMNNQEKVIVKIQKITPVKYNIEKSYKDKCINSVVANVVNDLIRYVEIKEIAPTLIKEDEDVDFRYKDGELDKMPVIAENISNIIKKPQKKKSKVELELLRLSCKVVNVEVEENSPEESCNKPYCQLGCVCKSLKCDGMITYHCQNVGCMLECKCPREKSIEYDKLMLPAGTDILSKDTVTRIEDEAKKDLAKVEREFTQMVIHTNDKTIVVGTGGRHKTRRSTKAPVKYSDYIDSNFECIEEHKKVKTQEKNNFSKECIVSLEKLSLQDIVPYCMLHNLYNCHCEGKLLSLNYSPKNATTKMASKPINEEVSEKKPTVDKKYLKNIKVTPPKQPKIQKEPLNNANVPNNSPYSEIKMSTSGRPIRINKKLTEDFTFFNELDFQVIGCARTVGVPINMRTKHKRSIKSLNRLIKNDFSNNISQADMLKTKLSVSSPELLEVDILKRQLVLESQEHQKSMSLLIEKALNESKHKRKQILEVRDDDAIPKPTFNQDLAVQRRKKTALVSKRNTIIEPVFDGEIIVDERNMELLQKMGNRTVSEGYARLLPWRALINSFNKGDVKIWCMVDQPSRLLINKSDKTLPKNYIDIRRTTQTTEVILWILRNKLPQRYHEDHISFILKQTKDNYEICGLCTKNFNDTNFITTEKEVTKVDTDKETGFFKHKDLNGVQQLMCLSKSKFKLQELVEETLAAVGETSIDKNKLYMWAALPEIYPMCKWRMIFLNSDFTFLYFTKVKYSIKYTDLLNASTKAKEANCTVILRNSVICNPNYHSAFGIYFDAHYQDRLFVGPYFKQHKYDDIETLRYINQSLVCTESFNKMQGKTDYKRGHWLVERPYSRTSGRFTIDLTKDTKGVKRKKELELPLFAKKQKFSVEENKRIIVTKNNDCIKVLDSEPKTPEEFNRYLITNIPHLGYLGAFQHEESSEIDVSWPFENKMLRFPSVSSATDFLQCRFSSLLQPVPETFKITIIVLTQIDLEKSKPIDVSILSGHYICGEFGCYNIKTITNEFCVNKIGCSREELLRIFARRAQLFVRQKIEELADVVNIPASEKGRNDIVNILDKARGDIESLTELEKRNSVEKDDLLLKKRELALKVFCLISVLPENEKNAETWKFRQILRKQSILLPKTVMDPIEILDSDDEDKNTSSQNENATKQEVECSINILSENLSDNNFKDRNYGLAEITPLRKVDRTKVILSKQSDLLKPPVVDKHVPNKRTQTTVATYPPQRKLKSILKSKTKSAVPIPTISRVETCSSLCGQLVSPVSQVIQSANKISNQRKQQYLTGVKLVKTYEGKLVLVSDNQPGTGKPFKFKSAGAKQFVIKNNEVLSVKSIGPLKIDGKKIHGGQNIESEKKSIKVPNSPPKTIILKKSALLRNKIFPANDKTLTTLLHNNGNENSLLKNSHLIVPQMGKIERDSKPLDNIEDSNNDKFVKSNSITATADKNTEICNVEIENVSNTNDNSIVNCSNLKLTEIPTQICNAIDDIGTHSKNTVEKSSTNSDEDKYRINQDNDEKDRINHEVDHNLSTQTSTTDESETPIKKRSDIEFDEKNNDASETLCSKDTSSLKESFVLNSTLKSDGASSLTQDGITTDTNTDETNETLKSNEPFDSLNDASRMERESDFGNPTQSDESSNMPFLVEAVSEIYPSKNDCEISTEINLTKAATLTQSKHAACDNLKNNLLPFENKDSRKDDSSANSNVNEQTVTSIHTIDAVNISKGIIDEILDSVISTSEESNVSLGKHFSNEISGSDNNTKEGNVEPVIYSIIDKDTNKIDFLAADKEIIPEISVDGKVHESSKKDICLEQKQVLDTKLCTTKQITPEANEDACCINKETTKNNIHSITTTEQNPIMVNEPVNQNERNDLNDDKNLTDDNFHNPSENCCGAVNCSKEVLPSLQTLNDCSKIDENIINSKDFKNSTGVNITNQITPQVEAITSDSAVTQTISNLVDQIKICGNAIKNECTSVNMEGIQNISISVAVTISTQTENSQKTTPCETVSLIVDDNDFSSECNSNKIKEPLLHRHDPTLSKRAILAKNKKIIKKDVVNKTAKKFAYLQFRKFRRQIPSSSLDILRKNNCCYRNTMLANDTKGRKGTKKKRGNSKKMICNNQLDHLTKSFKTRKVSGKNKKTPTSKKGRNVVSYKKLPFPISTSVTKENSLNMETNENKISENLNVDCQSKSFTTETDSIIKNTNNAETASELIYDQISNQSESTVQLQTSLKGSLKTSSDIVPRRKKLKKNTHFPKSCIKSKTKIMTSVVDDDIYKINTNTLNSSLPTLEGELNTIISNNSFGGQFEDEPNEDNVDVISNESNNQKVLINSDETKLNTAVDKFPQSKRISNVFSHILHADNSPNSYNLSKPCMNVQTDVNSIVIPKTNQHISSVVKETINKIEKSNNPPDLLSNDQDRNADHSCLTNCDGRKESSCDNKKGNNFSVISMETISQSANSSSMPKRTTIKCASAKVDTMFTIDTDSFPNKKSQNTTQSIKDTNMVFQNESTICDAHITKIIKKGTLSERGRIRKEMISTSDLIIASKMFNTENKEDKYIAEKISALAENTIKVKPLKVINKTSFLKNAQLAEKVIDIGNMKKKLHANICEDSCQKSNNCEENLDT